MRYIPQLSSGQQIVKTLPPPSLPPSTLPLSHSPSLPPSLLPPSPLPPSIPPSISQDKGAWLGGYKDKDGVEVRATDTVQAILSTHYELVESFDMPALMMEDPRMWFWLVDRVTVWRRKHDK